MIKKVKKSKIITSLVLTLAMVSSFASTSAFALNGAGNKGINLHGYYFDSSDRSHLKVYFDKSLTGTVKEQFKIERDSDHASQTISSLSTTSGGGWTNAAASTGTTVTLAMQNNFDYDTLYKVTISNTVSANNNLSLGSFQNRKDYVFYFKTPNSSGAYTTPINVTFQRASGATGVAYEGNVEFTVDRPVSSSDLSSLLSTWNSGIRLKKKISGTWTDVTTDSTFDSSATTGAESYAKQVNDAHTFFFYPLTAGGTASVAYDLENPNSHEYQLTVPSFNDVNSNNFGGSTTTFTTVASDIPSKLSAAPTVGTVGSTSVSLSWTGVIDATSYNVYYSTDPYWGFENHLAGNTSGTSYTVNGLSSSTTYYFRVTPVNTGGEAGYSPKATATTNP
ncbi:fibronectin type III domain-containing protein [Paenibacillus sp. SI8]|uniref:fibronectin type III domain-containing protein n=1 Tax=unclassified Paenibacillus TaxID=185978 RepID=UPI0034660833